MNTKKTEGTPRKRLPDWRESVEYKALVAHYVNRPIAIYTGAGVSIARNNKYGSADWEGIVRNILEKERGNDPVLLKMFDEQCKSIWKNEPWNMADWVVKILKEDSVKSALVEEFRQEKHFPTRRKKEEDGTLSKEYKQLSGNFLTSAWTMNAVCAFCGRFSAEVYGVKDKDKRYKISPNLRIRAIITTNYDCFLEAASSNMFIRTLLKPVGRFGSSVGSLHQIPVFHVHGYVPYPKQAPEADIPSMVDPVLTSKDYVKSYSDSKKQFTVNSQIHYLRHYTCLFIGFSFRDRWVNELLEEINSERNARKEAIGKRQYHFALMKMSGDERTKKEFEDRLGVKIIDLNDYDQIRDILKELYVAGLREDFGVESITLPLVPRMSPKQEDEDKHTLPDPPFSSIAADTYWNHLYYCRTGSVSKKHV